MIKALTVALAITAGLCAQAAEQAELDSDARNMAIVLKQQLRLPKTIIGECDITEVRDGSKEVRRVAFKMNFISKQIRVEEKFKKTNHRSLTTDNGKECVRVVGEDVTIEWANFDTLASAIVPHLYDQCESPIGRKDHLTDRVNFGSEILWFQDPFAYKFNPKTKFIEFRYELYESGCSSTLACREHVNIEGFIVPLKIAKSDHEAGETKEVAFIRESIKINQPILDKEFNQPIPIGAGVRNHINNESYTNYDISSAESQKECESKVKAIIHGEIEHHE